MTQDVWGIQYIDELVQIGINDDPADANEQVCETFYWALQDANYNLLGIVESDGDLKERYEYTPYGQRTVFKSAGSNDPLAMSPLIDSQQAVANYPHGICDVGHQGLLFDKEFGIYYNRARMLHPTMGRFMQRDPIGYEGGTNLYELPHSSPMSSLDPEGLKDYESNPWGLYWGGTYSQGDRLLNTGVGTISIGSNNLWPFKEGSTLAKVQCLLKKLGFDLPAPYNGLYWANIDSAGVPGYTIHGRVGPGWAYRAASFISSSTYPNEGNGLKCRLTEDLAVTLWHEMKGHNRDNQPDSKEFDKKYEQPVIDAYKMAEETPLGACCIVPPNEYREILSYLDLHCCECELEYSGKVVHTP